MNIRNSINSQFLANDVELNHNINTQMVAEAIIQASNLDESSIFSTISDAKRFILSIVDLTTLEGNDNEEKIKILCDKAHTILKNHNNTVAAICVYPTMVEYASKFMQNSNVHIASVAGAFPSGQSPLNIRIAEVEFAINSGANEIDMVISRGKFLEKNYLFVFDEIAAIRKTCDNKAHLKVILETGELPSIEQIYWASNIAINAGADFIKTSTGKIGVGATPEAIATMLFTIKKYYEKTGIKIGIKPSGGIANYAIAIMYVKLVFLILGREWLSPDLFRLGASRLVDELINP
ncbi:MAG: deoxyribose-phosphate aldolase [Bacteroidota bacterium]